MAVAFDFSWSLLMAVTITLILATIYVIVWDFYTWYHLPPGPLPFPILGNIPLLLRFKTMPFETFETLSKTYGPVYTLWFGRSPNIMISDPEIANLLMRSRGVKYSSRPHSIMYGDVFDNGTDVVFTPDNAIWALQRKILNGSFNPAAVVASRELVEAEATKTVTEMLNRPDKWSGGFQRFASSIIFSIAYGRRFDSIDSEILQARMNHMSYGVELLRPGRFLVESFRFLKYVPEIFTPWIKTVRARGQQMANFDLSLIETVRQDLRAGNGTGQGTLVGSMLQRRDNKERGMELMNARQFAGLPTSIFNAGTETIFLSLLMAMLALLTHPEVLKTAQKELSEVVGEERSPNFTDQKNLPYITAMVEEVLRWRPVGPLSAPHLSTEDDLYQGYRIPKGTAIIPLVWTMHRDAEYFPSPSQFAPERFLPASDPRYVLELQGKPFPGKWTSGAFGWGRRACAGSDLATTELFILLAKITWAFDIVKTEGETYDVDAFVGGMVLKPREFTCNFRVKSERHSAILQREDRAADMFLEKFPAFE